MSFLKYISFALLILIVLFSCKKDSFITSSAARLSVSTDTLNYDTVFVTTGSIIQSFKIFNLNNQKLRLSKIKLSGGAASAFKMNVDGTSATEINDVEINADDSLYVFVQVNVNPTADNLPFIISDSILISYNGNDRFVQLQAYGQNAKFLRDVRISGNVIWTNELPYVILGSLTVDTTATLTIQPGCRIYSHADAPFLVDGTLIVAGTKQDSVVFTSDRLDVDYKDLPAGWPGIYLRNSSKDNNIKFAVIKNAYQALVIQQLAENSNPKLLLSQSIIDNSYDAGILGINTNIWADNCLISNCGSNILLGYGGDYRFVHCTAASYSNLFVNHTNPVLQVSNFIKQDNHIYTTDLNAVFTDCIFWGDGGNVKNEIVINKEDDPASAFNVTLDHVLYKAEDNLQNTAETDVIKNQDPMFDSVNTGKMLFDFHFNNSVSPAIDMGVITSYPKDLDDNPRVVGLKPDLGCYEKQ